MAKHRKRKVGRPPIPAAMRLNRVLQFRMRDGLYQKLFKAAGTAGYSVSEEIERRLQKSFEPERIELLIRAAVLTGIDSYVRNREAGKRANHRSKYLL